eukprot:6202921-Pleurochrysis_carterae.AAC.7
MATGDVGRLQTLLERRRKAKTHGTKDGVKLIVQLARELSTWEPENAVALLEEVRFHSGGCNVGCPGGIPFVNTTRLISTRPTHLAPGGSSLLYTFG